VQRLKFIFNGADSFFSKTRGVFNSHGRPVIGFHKTSTKQGVSLEIRNENAETVGYYEELRFKSFNKNKGILKLVNGLEWISVETTSAAGDFYLKDNNGNFIASYRFGYFDYALEEAFQKAEGYELVKINEKLTRNEKVLIAAVICYWMGYKAQGIR